LAQWDEGGPTEPPHRAHVRESVTHITGASPDRIRKSAGLAIAPIHRGV
jgi:hypothetical protein